MTAPTTTDAARKYDDMSRQDLVDRLIEQESLAEALAAANDERAQARAESSQARAELRELKNEITSQFRELIAQSSIDKDVAFEVCESLGADKPVSTYTVEVMVTVTVELEADDEEDAESLVKDALEVTCELGDAAGNWDTQWVADSYTTTEQ